jgi:hypothetical protein
MRNESLDVYRFQTLEINTRIPDIVFSDKKLEAFA